MNLSISPCSPSPASPELPHPTLARFDLANWVHLLSGVIGMVTSLVGVRIQGQGKKNCCSANQTHWVGELWGSVIFTVCPFGVCSLPYLANPSTTGLSCSTVKTDLLPSQVPLVLRKSYQLWELWGILTRGDLEGVSSLCCPEARKGQCLHQMSLNKVPCLLALLLIRSLLSVLKGSGWRAGPGYIVQAS